MDVAGHDLRSEMNWSVLSGAAGVAGLVLSLWVAYRTQVRRDKMSVRLLAPPDEWKVMPGFPGASSACAVEDGSVIYASGTSAAIITNDGPRGGAVWGFEPDTSRIPSPWWLQNLTTPGQPYHLSGSGCEGVTFGFTLACSYDDLRAGTAALQADGEVHLGLRYKRLGWRGWVRQRKKTQVRVPREDLIKALTLGWTDVAECSLIGWLRIHAEEVYRELSVDKEQLKNLMMWARLPDDYKTVIEEINGNPGSYRLGIQRAGNSHVDQGWFVVADGQLATLQAIADKLASLTHDVRARRSQERKIMGMTSAS